jgi:hypothetical protein
MSEKKKHKSDLIHPVCSFCGEQHPQTYRPSKIPEHDYIMCKSCKKARVKVPHEADEVVVNVGSIMGWNSYIVRESTEEDEAAMERARRIRDVNMAKLRRENDKWN